MASEPFSVDTEGLHLQMPYMETLGAHFKSLHADLQARLDGIGDCWGHDATGKEFYSHYADPRDGILDGINGIGDVVINTSVGIKTMSVQFERLEDANIAGIGDLHLNDNSLHVPGSEGRTGKK